VMMATRYDEEIDALRPGEQPDVARLASGVSRTTPPSDAPPAEALALIAEARGRQRRRRRRQVVVVGLVVLAVLAGTASYLGVSSSSSSGAAKVFASAESRTWHSAGPTIWLQGGAPNYLGAGLASTISCAGADRSTCYVVIQENGYQPDGARTMAGVSPGFAPFRSTAYRSTDNEAGWTELNLPPSTWLSSPIACASATTCAVGAVLNAGHSADTPGSVVTFLTTTDAGRSWVEHAMPSWVGLVTDVACPQASRCIALAWNSDAPTINGLQPWAGADRLYATSVLTTEDGGRSWTTSRLPGRTGEHYLYLSGVTCAGDDCAFIGDNARIAPYDGAYLIAETAGVVLSSSDAGRTLATTYSTALEPWALACDGPTSCLMLLTNERTASSVLTGGIEGPWHRVQARGLPALSAPLSLSCPASGDCIASGQQVAVTTDNGAQWSKPAPLPGPLSGYANNFPGQISCSPSGRCLLLDTMVLPPAGPAGPSATRVLANGS
jgi:hypothetical protein